MVDWGVCICTSFPELSNTTDYNNEKNLVAEYGHLWFRLEVSLPPKAEHSCVSKCSKARGSQMEVSNFLLPTACHE